MQHSYNERWERTKRYLFRNLLVDPGFCLSPVPEESRSDSSDDRPYSPLPELIVEREPNKHDDSQEYYQGLERRMKRYYMKLFLEGADVDSLEYKGLVNIDDDISEFDVDKSMASTFVLDSNYHKDTEASRLIFNKHKADSEKKNLSDENILNKTQDVSQHIEVPLDEHVEFIQHEPNAVTNISEDRRVSNEELLETVETESDSTQGHRISTTAVQIHEEKKRSDSATRVFEDGSPVLIPRLHKFSSHIFGSIFADKTKVVSLADKYVAEGSRLLAIQEQLNKSIEEKTLNQVEKQKNMGKNNEYFTINPEVQNLNKPSEASEADKSSILDTIQTNQIEEKACSYKHKEVVVPENRSHSITKFTGDTDEKEACGDEESIGPNEFDYTQKTRIESTDSEENSVDEAVDNSFEMAMRRGIFESINKKKTSAHSSVEESTSSSIYNSDECEPVEVMRGASEVESLEYVRRNSTLSQESPLVGAFALSTIAEFEEETSSLNEGQINASTEDADTGECQYSPHIELIVQKGTSLHESTRQSSEYNLDLFESKVNQCKASLNTGLINESSIDEEEATPTIPANNLVTTFCQDIWSVSPIEVDVADLSPIVENKVSSTQGQYLNNGKRKIETQIDLEKPVKKTKTFQNVEVQTSAHVECHQGWADVEKDFFVGAPLVFNLCSCQNHTCP